MNPTANRTHPKTMADETYAAAEVASALRDDPSEWIRNWAGLIDDPETVAYLNYLDDRLPVPVEETERGKRIIRSSASSTLDDAIRAGNVSQMKAATGITNQREDGADFYAQAAKRLSHEGAIGIVFGPPGVGKTTTTIDTSLSWRARTGGHVIGNTSYSGFDRQFTSDTEMLKAMGNLDGPVLAIVDEIAQELSGFGSGSKQAEAFSDALLFVRKLEERHGPYPKKGSVLLVGHTRKKVAKSIRRVASFGIEKPYKGRPDVVRLLDSEGGKDQWSEGTEFSGLTDGAEAFAEYEPSEFRIEEAYDDNDGGETLDLDKVRKQEAIRTVVRAKVHQGMTYPEIAGEDDNEDNDGMVDYSAYWCGEQFRAWKSGDHDFVDIERP